MGTKKTQKDKTTKLYAHANRRKNGSCLKGAGNGGTLGESAGRAAGCQNP